MPIAHIHRSLDYNRGGVLYPVKDSRWILRNAQARVSYSLFNKMHIGGNYTINQELPSLTRMIDITDTTDPLMTYLGNRDLSTVTKHSVNLNTTIFRRNSYNVNANFNATFINGEYIQSRLYDTATGYSTYKWLNSPVGSYHFMERVAGDVQVGPRKNISIKAEMYSTQYRSAMMTGEDAVSPTLYVMNNYSYQPTLGLTYEFGKSRIGLSGSLNLRHNTSSRVSATDINSQDYKYGVKGVFKLPYDFGISTDFFICQRRGYDSPQLNTNDLLWNMRLSKSFHKGRWLLSVDGFDLLHQLTNVRYSVSPSGRVESYSNTLPRYVLVHLQYKMNILPKKKELTGKTYAY